MTEQHDFDRDYWERHWQQTHHGHSGAAGAGPPHPYLAGETTGLTPGTALDAGCGTGAEALWLAGHGWQVTAVDIASAALAVAAGRATAGGVSERVRWVEADLTTWDPGTRFDLVTTHYAHPAMPQLAFYDRISTWVAPGGTLLIVGHLHAPGATGHGHHPPAEASVTVADITAGLDPATWEVTTAEEHHRTVTGPGGQENPLHDVVVRATRRP
ncbi:class I SAM-dependent methyltransferase [Micromonospora sp. STR1_7]|uniref:Class I SAM-dependent methyltransferase n=1 Tax=Micromonospora parastrephiae TaxID=2806101 RepID=A0ABS1XTG7_9ACTN|nr:class I SAM-dependent methyltransferase [Micromonospora parastrephiae]MBM0232518.1 class I SAM-dependent methyltransferase [Micromonospora parastrephiae]